MATRFDPFQEMDRLMGQVLGSQRAAASMPMEPVPVRRPRRPARRPAGCRPGLDRRARGRPHPDDPRTAHSAQRTAHSAQRTAGTDEGTRWLAEERPTGTWARQPTVGRGLALDAITASCTDGVLTLTIPVAEEARPRRIEVSTGGTPATIEAGGEAPQTASA